MTNDLKNLALQLRSADNILITSHVNPDGDAVGSVLAAAYLLKAIGKRVFPVLEKPIPKRYAFLAGADTFETLEQAKSANRTYGATLLLDAGDLDRMGDVQSLRPDSTPLFLVDHHVADMQIADAYHVSTKASATCELLVDLFHELNIEIKPEAASALYTGVLTDTGQFRFTNTTPRALQAASELVAAGADPALIAREIYFREDPDSTAALGRFLTRMEFHAGGKLVVSFIPLDEPRVDTERFIDHLTAIDGVEIAAMLRPLGDSVFKVSLRSTGDADVEKVARVLGGGGHVKAAGGTVKGEVESAKREVIEACKAQIAAL